MSFQGIKLHKKNEVVEKKNITLQEMARVMLKSRSVPIKFWAEAINMAYYIHNRVYHRSRTQMTLNEIWKGKKPNMKHLHKFGCPCCILNDREQRGKVNAKSDEGVFLGYSSNSSTYRVYNKRTMAIMESINVKVDDHLP